MAKQIRIDADQSFRSMSVRVCPDRLCRSNIGLATCEGLSHAIAGIPGAHSTTCRLGGAPLSRRSPPQYCGGLRDWAQSAATSRARRPPARRKCHRDYTTRAFGPSGRRSLMPSEARPGPIALKQCGPARGALASSHEEAPHDCLGRGAALRSARIGRGFDGRRRAFACRR